MAMRFTSHKNQFGPRRTTYERLAREKQREAAWYYKIAMEQGSTAYQRVAADLAKTAMMYLDQCINYKKTGGKS